MQCLVLCAESHCLVSGALSLCLFCFVVLQCLEWLRSAAVSGV